MPQHRGASPAAGGAGAIACISSVAAIHIAYKPLGYMVDDAVNFALQDGRIPAIFESYGLTHLPPVR